MSLPRPDELQELSGLIIQQGKLCYGKWEQFQAVLASLMQKLGPAAAQAGATQAVSALGVASGVTLAAVGPVGLTIAPIGAVLAPWIAAAVVASQASQIFSLHDLKDDAAKGGGSAVSYGCRCGQCARNIQYVVDKKERNVGLVAIGVGTLGVSAIVKGLHSLGKKLYSAAKGEERPKERVSKAIVELARAGCTAAMAVIFLLSGSWWQMGDRNARTMATAVATMTSEDGWAHFKGCW